MALVCFLRVQIDVNKEQRDIVGILQQQRSHPCLLDHGPGHQGSPAPEELHTQNKPPTQAVRTHLAVLPLLHVAKDGQSKANQGEDEGCYGDGQHISLNVSGTYMVSSPSQVDTYWPMLLPLFGNYKLEPENPKNKISTKNY